MDDDQFPPEVVEALAHAIDLARDDARRENAVPFEASAIAALRTIVPLLPALGYRRVGEGEVAPLMELAGAAAIMAEYRRWKNCETARELAENMDPAPIYRAMLAAAPGRREVGT